MKTLTTWVNHAVQYVSSLQVLNKLVVLLQYFFTNLSEFFQRIQKRIFKTKTGGNLSSSTPVPLQDSSFSKGVKSFFLNCITLASEFNSKHNSVQTVIAGLGVILSPSFIFSGKFFNLLDVIQGMANGYQVNLLPFVRLLLETLIFFYFLWIVVSFFITRHPSNNHSSKFDGIHSAVTLTYIDMHLLAGETTTPGQDEETVKNLYAGVPSVTDFLTENDEGFQAYKENSSLMEVIEMMYPVEEREKHQQKPQTKTLLELLNENDPAPEDEIQAFLTTLNQ